MTVTETSLTSESKSQTKIVPRILVSDAEDSADYVKSLFPDISRCLVCAFEKTIPMVIQYGRVFKKAYTNGAVLSTSQILGALVHGDKKLVVILLNPETNSQMMDSISACIEYGCPVVCHFSVLTQCFNPLPDIIDKYTYDSRIISFNPSVNRFFTIANKPNPDPHQVGLRDDGRRGVFLVNTPTHCDEARECVLKFFVDQLFVETEKDLGKASKLYLKEAIVFVPARKGTFLGRWLTYDPDHCPTFLVPHCLHVFVDMTPGAIYDLEQRVMNNDTLKQTSLFVCVVTLPVKKIKSDTFSFLFESGKGVAVYASRKTAVGHYEEPKTEPPKLEEPESEEPKPEEPKPEEPKQEEPNPEEPKQEEPKPEETKPDEPKPEEPKPEEPKPEEPKPEEPKQEEPKPEEPKPEKPKPEEPKQEEPKPELNTEEVKTRISVLPLGTKLSDVIDKIEKAAEEDKVQENKMADFKLVQEFRDALTNLLNAVSKAAGAATDAAKSITSADQALVMTSKTAICRSKARLNVSFAMLNLASDINVFYMDVHRISLLAAVCCTPDSAGKVAAALQEGDLFFILKCQTSEIQDAVSRIPLAICAVTKVEPNLTFAITNLAKAIFRMSRTIEESLDTVSEVAKDVLELEGDIPESIRVCQRCLESNLSLLRDSMTKVDQIDESLFQPAGSQVATIPQRVKTNVLGTINERVIVAEQDTVLRFRVRIDMFPGQKFKLGRGFPVEGQYALFFDGQHICDSVIEYEKPVFILPDKNSVLGGNDKPTGFGEQDKTSVLGGNDKPTGFGEPNQGNNLSKVYPPCWVHIEMTNATESRYLCSPISGQFYFSEYEIDLPHTGLFKMNPCARYRVTLSPNVLAIKSTQSDPFVLISDRFRCESRSPKNQCFGQIAKVSDMFQNIIEKNCDPVSEKGISAQIVLEAHANRFSPKKMEVSEMYVE